MGRKNANYAVEMYSLVKAYIEKHVDTLYEYINAHGECADTEQTMHQTLEIFENEKYDNIKNEEFIHELFNFEEVLREYYEDEDEAYEAASKFALYIEENYVV